MLRSGRVFRVPREWSNRELRRFGPIFGGEVVNVSGWKDEDKQGGVYRDYFPSAASYAITNFERGYGYQGRPGEILLDLTAKLPEALARRFDVVFNHTTLEHIYDTDLAFENLCEMSRDVVILVVPFLQPVHEGEDGAYSDFWRFSPAAVRKMFEERGLTPLYVSCNDDLLASVYVFGIAAREPERWRAHFEGLPTSPRTRPGGRAVTKLRTMLTGLFRGS